MRVSSSLLLQLLVVVAACLFSLTVAQPYTPRLLEVISESQGVALSASGTTAYVLDANDGYVYVIPLPAHAPLPAPFFSNPYPNAQYASIAASASTSPQLVYLLDAINAQIVSISVSNGPNPTPTVVYDFGQQNQYLQVGFFLQQQTNVLYVTQSQSSGDQVLALDLNSATPTPILLYTAPFGNLIGGIAATYSPNSPQTTVYFSSQFNNNSGTPEFAAIYSITLAGPTTPAPFNEAEAVLAVGPPLYSPLAFQVDPTNSILYIVDTGNANAQAFSVPHSVLALSPLYSSPSLTTLYTATGSTTEVSFPIALSPNAPLIYFCALGGRNGLYSLNGSVTLPPQPSSSSAAPQVLSSSAAPHAVSSSAKHSVSSSPGKYVTSKYVTSKFATSSSPKKFITSSSKKFITSSSSKKFATSSSSKKFVTSSSKKAK